MRQCVQIETGAETESLPSHLHIADYTHYTCNQYIDGQRQRAWCVHFHVFHFLRFSWLNSWRPSSDTCHIRKGSWSSSVAYLTLNVPPPVSGGTLLRKPGLSLRLSADPLGCRWSSENSAPERSGSPCDSGQYLALICLFQFEL